MATQPKAGRPEEARRQVVKKLISSLYNANSTFLDQSAVPTVDFYEFFSRDDVFNAASHFADELLKIWNEQHPASRFPLAHSRKSSDNPAASKPTVDSIETQSKAATANNLAASIADAQSAHIPEETMTQATEPEPPARPVPQPTQPTPEASSPQPLLNPSAHPGVVPPVSRPPGTPNDPTASFQVPNAKQGQSYVGRIVEASATPRAMQFRNLSLPANLGLVFNEATGELSGTPAQAGDHAIALQWSANNSPWYAGKLVLVINPDPRSLWKIKEPPADAPYPKSHTDEQLLVAADFRVAAASRRGRSHEHAGSFRDDDFYVRHDEQSGWSVLIVADGAGSAKNSRKGSELAVQAAGEHIFSSLVCDADGNIQAALAHWDADPDGKSFGTLSHNLFHRAGVLAVQAIEDEAAAQGASVKDYATTLLVAAVKRQGNQTFLATFWMGDGAIAAYGPRGQVRLMGSPDGGEFAGQTRFLDRAALTDQSYAKRVSVGRLADISAVILLTDGISDPRFETDNGLANAAKWDALWDEIQPCLAAENPAASLVDWLQFFSPGHHDDRTIALLW